ncbi:hypothetical protein B0H14DRAFT_2563469 [Mycena olivaceomarginata]|nr:hypothetical protein B0H14DRAFT_2563469 [Mycena olivaceomarginata]
MSQKNSTWATTTGTGTKRRKASTRTNNPSGPQTIRSYKVTEEPDGTLVCNCPEFRATGKVCTEILAAVADKFHLDEPAAKGKKKPAKVTLGKARGSGKRGQHPLADHRVERDYKDFLGRLDKGWAPFDSDSEEFTDPDLETQPKKKKKSGEPQKPTQNRVSAGRPAVSTPLHPGRSSVSPTKFNHKLLAVTRLLIKNATFERETARAITHERGLQSTWCKGGK